MFSWSKLEKPIKLLAPMAGYTGSAFRQICRELGADLVMTELISADAIYFALKKSKQRLLSSKTFELMQFNQAERPVIIQLFGKDPEKFKIAAKFIEQELKADGIDLNLGCSVRKVLRSGHGAALLKSPEKIIEIIAEIKKAVKIPISVKTRLGFSSPNEILDIGPKIAQAGAQAIIVHGRTVKAGFSGKADWENIYQMKDKLKDVVVIGNGDINSYSEIGQRIGNLDGVAIGRAALAKPWVFSTDKIKLDDIIKIAIRHSELNFKCRGKHGIIEMRKSLIWYFKGLPDAVKIRSQIVKIETMNDIKKILLLIKKEGEV